MVSTRASTYRDRLWADNNLAHTYRMTEVKSPSTFGRSVSSLRFKLRNLMHHDRSVRVRREFRRRDGGVHALAHDLSGDAEGSFASIVDQVREAVPRFAAHEILPPESLAHASIVLLSFVVFAGGWRVRFSRARTTDAVFHLGPGRTKKVQDGGLPKPMLRLCRGIGLKSAAVI